MSSYNFNDTMEFESDDELYTFIENPSDLEDEFEFERLFKDEGDNSNAEYLLTTARVSEKLNRPVDYHEISVESRQENFLDITTHLLGEIAVHLGMDSNEVQSSYIHYILCNTYEDLIGRCYCCPLSDFWNFLGGNSIYKS
ncbi:hypothetical protein TRFO_25213 [Tritrichomonas foetus]|uniref:Uncharacterized protein n=1 Tax=Tritrichomonas foetus TaxID=1144522 RepID=A0A1J4KB34_9EUKA|nr:hypothetical protein TRFO_25213 [Tritrichomonas foetus]|eukprot:OHT06677.1 hypothetical protein TRFO_25213 [Tritrichomonas foetus]